MVSGSSPPEISKLKRSDEAFPRPSSKRFHTERSSRQSRSSTLLPLPNFFSTKNTNRGKVDHRSFQPKQIPVLPHIQDVRYKGVKIQPSFGSVLHVNRPEVRIPPYSHSPKISKVLGLRPQRKSLLFQSTPVRFLSVTSNIHKGLRLPFPPPKKSGNSDIRLHRRLAALAYRPKHPHHRHFGSHLASPGTWFRDKLQEVFTKTIAKDYTPRGDLGRSRRYYYSSTKANHDPSVKSQNSSCQVFYSESSKSPRLHKLRSSPHPPGPFPAQGVHSTQPRNSPNNFIRFPDIYPMVDEGIGVFHSHAMEKPTSFANSMDGCICPSMGSGDFNEPNHLKAMDKGSPRSAHIPQGSSGHPLSVKGVGSTTEFFDHCPLRQQSGMLFSDKQGFNRIDKLAIIAKMLVSFLEQKQLFLKAVHLPGHLNTWADSLSRTEPVATEWCLSERSFRNLPQLEQPLQIDLFAHPGNTKLPTFGCPFRHPQVTVVDALTSDWNNWTSIYLFPPRNLLPKVLEKLATYRGQGILIVPFVPLAPWWTLIPSQAKPLAQN